MVEIMCLRKKTWKNFRLETYLARFINLGDEPTGNISTVI